MEKLFKFQSKNEDTNNLTESINKNTIDIEVKGFRDAGAAGGEIAIFTNNLNSIYSSLNATHEENSNEENHKNTKRELEIEKLEKLQEKKRQQITTLETRDIPEIESQIDKVRKEVKDIKLNPDKYTQKTTDSLKMFIVAGILIGLTIYLWFFYGSVAFSAFFREITFTKNSIFNTIFYAGAWSEAWQSGFTALLIILFIPFVFLALGILVHIFQEPENRKKYLLPIVYLFSFLFDCLLAYEITQKIYEAKALNSFTNLKPYSIQEAIFDINFWIIIASGFVVYIVWGYLFNYYQEQRSYSNKINRLLSQKNHEITDLKNELSNISQKKINLENELNELERQSISLTDKNFTPEHKYQIITVFYQYANGWLNFLSSGKFNPSSIQEIKEITESYIERIKND